MKKKKKEGYRAHDGGRGKKRERAKTLSLM
jgi:hypothetical protein